MRVLCNLPLECFDDRSTFAPIDLVTYGPADRVVVDGHHYPPDVVFDPSTGTLEELLASLPNGWRPDLILIWWPDQDPLPEGLERSAVPVVAVVSDYNLTLPYTAQLWPFFDVVLVDRSGVDVLQGLGFADVRPFVQFSFKRRDHRIHERTPRTIDVGFAGNLNPVVQRERAPWLARVARLRDRGIGVDIRSGVFGDAYGRFLSSVRIGFNRSIRGEMNLRAFEVPACGALLMIERENLEVRDFLTPGEECVLYGDDDFESIVQSLLDDPGTIERIAAAGHRRVQSHRMGDRLRAMLDFLRARGPGRPESTPFDRALGRGTAMLATWARGTGNVRCLLEACRLAPNDPRPWNALGVAMLRADPERHLRQAYDAFVRAAALSPSYAPAALNAALLLQSSDRPDLRDRHLTEAARRLTANATFADLDGPLLPSVFSERAIDASHALARAVRAGSPRPLADALLPV